MTNNQGVKDFIKNHPEEFNELVEIFKNLKFDNNNSSGTSEEIELTTAINVLKDKFGLSDFVKELITKVSLKKLLAIIKGVIKSKKEKVNDNLKKSSKLLENLELEFKNLPSSELSSLKPINTPENNECAISSRHLSNLKRAKSKGPTYDF